MRKKNKNVLKERLLLYNTGKHVEKVFCSSFSKFSKIKILKYKFK
jgi:hypothetical protein